MGALWIATLFFFVGGTTGITAGCAVVVLILAMAFFFRLPRNENRQALCISGMGERREGEDDMRGEWMKNGGSTAKSEGGEINFNGVTSLTI